MDRMPGTGSNRRWPGMVFFFIPAVLSLILIGFVVGYLWDADARLSNEEPQANLGASNILQENPDDGNNDNPLLAVSKPSLSRSKNKRAKNRPALNYISQLSPGSYGLKKIENIVIESANEVANDPKINSVFLDVFYPAISENSVREQPFPLVVISHPTVVPSMAPARKSFSYLVDYLVSHGYVVAAYEWTYDIDNCAMIRNANRERNILDFLTEETRDEQSPLYGLIDTQTVGLVGHSNGSFAQHFAKVDNRVKAMVSLSGLLCEWVGLYSDVVDLEKPYMYIGATQDQLRANTARFTFYGLWEKHQGPKIMFDVKDGDHWQFTDDYVYYPDVLLQFSYYDDIFQNVLKTCERELSDQDQENDEHCKKTYIPRELQQDIARYYTKNFFDMYLKKNDVSKEALLGSQFSSYMANFTSEKVKDE